MEELYTTVTARIIAQLEEGRLPWVQPWDGSVVVAGLPRNAGSGRAYSGINILILWHALFEGGFTAQRWLTFKQAEALGGHVRKGERGVTVCYADRFTPRDARGGDGGVGSAAGGRGGADVGASSGSGDELRQVAFLKRFTVFNVAQCDGLPDRLYQALESEPRADPVTIPEAEALIAASGARISTGAPHACYSPGADRIEVPMQAAFTQPINYYRTVLHELGHWTGMGPGSTAIRPGALAVHLMDGRNWSRRCAAPSPARLWASCRPCAMPITLPAGWTCSRATIGRSSGRPVKRARRRIICWPFGLAPMVCLTRERWHERGGHGQ
jgi:antirestriction protein ArdC